MRCFLQQRQMRWQNQAYRPCRRFMLVGGIYGRSTQYPWRAMRMRRIFRRVIRSDFRREEPWRQRTANALAFNSMPMVPVFAYEWRPPRFQWRSPPPRKTQPIHLPEQEITLKRAA